MPATYESIASQTLGSGSTGINFSSIPATYTDLVVVITGTVSSNDSYGFRFNGDTATNYSFTGWYGSGGNVYGTYKTTGASKIESGRSSTTQGIALFYVSQYANTNVFKTTFGKGTIPSSYLNSHVGLWRSTAAINAINISTYAGYTMNTGTVFSLYGIKAA